MSGIPGGGKIQEREMGGHDLGCHGGGEGKKGGVGRRLLPWGNERVEKNWIRDVKWMVRCERGTKK